MGSLVYQELPPRLSYTGSWLEGYKISNLNRFHQHFTFYHCIRSENVVTRPSIKTSMNDAKMTAWKDFFFHMLLQYSRVNLFRFRGSFHTLPKTLSIPGFIIPARLSHFESDFTYTMVRYTILSDSSFVEQAYHQPIILFTRRLGTCCTRQCRHVNEGDIKLILQCIIWRS